MLVDANLLIYAFVSESRQHERARDWLNQSVSGEGRVGLPWHSIIGFLRIVTNARIFSEPQPIAHAWDQVERWLSWPSTFVPMPGEEHARILAKLLAGGVSGDLVPDAHLAALALEHGLAVYSCDSDFAKFEGVRWVDPLRANR